MLKLGIAVELIALSVAAVGRWENPLSAFTITCFGFGLILIGVLKNDQRSH